MRAIPLTAAECHDFRGYLRNCTDAQVSGVLEKEIAGNHHQEIDMAASEARRRNIEVPRAALYVNFAVVERNCDHCGNPYRGPAVYCSLDCAQADA